MDYGWEIYPVRLKSDSIVSGHFKADGITDFLLSGPMTGTNFVATVNAPAFPYQQGG